MFGYPRTVAEVLRPNKTYKPGVISAVKKFKRAKTWKEVEGSPFAESEFDDINDYRFACMKTLIRELAEIYEINVPVLQMLEITNGDSGSSSYHPASHTITMRGRLSVVTLLHEFGHARGFGEKKACIFSINLFKRVFPKQYERLLPVGHTLRRDLANLESVRSSMESDGSLLQRVHLVLGD